MKWFELKEQAAGTKRLLLTWYIYKLFGKKAVKLITFFVTLFAFLGAKENKNCSKKYLKIVGIKPSNFNVFKHFLSYAYSLADRMESFSNNFPVNKIKFQSEEDKRTLENDLKAKKGIFFICSHLGNIDIMRSFIFSDWGEYCSEVCVFLSKEQCKIFNGFVEQIGTACNQKVSSYPIEDIDVNTSIEIEEKLNTGAIVFMAGDRTSAHSSNFETEFLSHKADFPLGTFKFAQLMNVCTYFICAIKTTNDNYSIHFKRFEQKSSKKETLNSMKKEFVSFLESETKLAPFQFYHFYDLFKN